MFPAHVDVQLGLPASAPPRMSSHQGSQVADDLPTLRTRNVEGNHNRALYTVSQDFVDRQITVTMAQSRVVQRDSDSSHSLAAMTQRTSLSKNALSDLNVLVGGVRILNAAVGADAQYQLLQGESAPLAGHVEKVAPGQVGDLAANFQREQTRSPPNTRGQLLAGEVELAVDVDGDGDVSSAYQEVVISSDSVPAISIINDGIKCYLAKVILSNDT